MAVFFNSSSSMEENIDECQLGKDFQDATPLQYDHVLALLEASAAKNSKDEEPSKQFSQSLEYVRKFAQFGSGPKAEELREKFERLKLKEVEQVQLANLHPETVEQARVLIPSLAKYDESVIQEAITIMLCLRKAI